MITFFFFLKRQSLSFISSNGHLAQTSALPCCKMKKLYLSHLNTIHIIWDGVLLYIAKHDFCLQHFKF